jgi:hypothetical protein
MLSLLLSLGLSSLGSRPWRLLLRDRRGKRLLASPGRRWRRFLLRPTDRLRLWRLRFTRRLGRLRDIGTPLRIRVWQWRLDRRAIRCLILRLRGNCRLLDGQRRGCCLSFRLFGDWLRMTLRRLYGRGRLRLLKRLREVCARELRQGDLLGRLRL